jgi:hypothetical protein
VLILNGHEQNVLRTICNTVRLNFVDSGNYETINIIPNKPLGIISWLIKKLPTNLTDKEFKFFKHFLAALTEIESAELIPYRPLWTNLKDLLLNYLNLSFFQQ